MENKVLEQNIEQIKQYDSNLANEILMFNMQKSNLQLVVFTHGQLYILYLTKMICFRKRTEISG